MQEFASGPVHSIQLASHGAHKYSLPVGDKYLLTCVHIGTQIGPLASLILALLHSMQSRLVGPWQPLHSRWQTEQPPSPTEQPCTHWSALISDCSAYLHPVHLDVAVQSEQTSGHGIQSDPPLVNSCS